MTTTTMTPYGNDDWEDEREEEEQEYDSEVSVLTDDEDNARRNSQWG